jgi:hypothetical protein
MKKMSLAVVGTLLVGMLIAPGISAFQKGENRLSNSDFEKDTVGDLPEQWMIEKGG